MTKTPRKPATNGLKLAVLLAVCYLVSFALCAVAFAVVFVL